MVHLRLGTSTLITTPERDALSTLRSRYMEVGLRHRAQFLSGFPAFKCADELFQSFPEAISRAFNEAANMAANDIAMRRVYDVDLATIRQDLSDRIEAIRDSFDRIQGRYSEIIGKSAELDAQRTADRENRARIVGGGFGLQGAVGGMAMAAAANAAIGLSYGLANLTAKAASVLGDAKKKRALVEDPATKRVLANFLCRVVLQGYKLVAEVVNHRAENEVFAVVLEQAQRKAAAIVQNVNADRLRQADVANALIQALELDPFNDNAWDAWIDRFGDSDGSVAGSAEALGITRVRSHKKKVLARKRANLDWSTPEACQRNCPILEADARWLGLPFDDERERIRALIEKLEIERRTFDHILYETVAEAQKARREAAQRESDRLVSEKIKADERSRTLFGVTYGTKEDFEEARRNHNNKVLNSCFIIFMAPVVVGILICFALIIIGVSRRI